MSDHDLGEFFGKHAPVAPTPAESAAALEAARPSFIAARSRHRAGLAGAGMIALLIVGGAMLDRDTNHRTESVAAPAQPPASTTATGTGTTAQSEHFESPGGSVDAAIDVGELTLIASMPADGYVAMVDLVTADRLEVSFTGPERHVIALVLDDGEIIEDAPDAPASPTTTTPPPPSTAAPTTTLGAAEPDGADESDTAASDTDEQEASTPAPPTTEPPAKGGPNSNWDWTPGDRGDGRGHHGNQGNQGTDD